VIVVPGAGPGDIATRVEHRRAGQVEGDFVAGRGRRRRKTCCRTRPGLQTGEDELKMRVDVFVIAFQGISEAVTLGRSPRFGSVNGDDMATAVSAQSRL
jgi:hypothetical protein